MGIFTKGKSQPAGSAQRPGTAVLASGRRLRSALSPPDCVTALEQVFGTYRQRRYRDLPHLVPCGIQWLRDGGTAPLAVCGSDESDNFLLFTLAATTGGTDAGIFPLGSGDARLALSVVGHWKRADGSLSSTGTWPAGTVLLTAPPVDDQLLDGTLLAAGYPVIPANRARLAQQLFEMFLVKSHQFIQSKSGSSTADRFVDDQKRRADWTSLTGPLRSTLQALGEWQAGVLPYVQDLPLRCCALLLEPGGGDAPVWSQMERSG
jgi:hypothetical protein